jgi:hypothetical protein
MSKIILYIYTYFNTNWYDRIILRPLFFINTVCACGLMKELKWISHYVLQNYELKLDIKPLTNSFAFCFAFCRSSLALDVISRTNSPADMSLDILSLFPLLPENSCSLPNSASLLNDVAPENLPIRSFASLLSLFVPPSKSKN